MTTVWSVSADVTNFNHLASRYETDPIPPLNLGASQLESWGRRQVWYHPAEFRKSKSLANFPGWSSGIACDAEAKENLQKLIGDHAEFLPLIFASSTIVDTTYYAINVLRMLDCLDYKRSEFTYFERTGNIRKVHKFEFKLNCIGGIPIFKLPILRSIRTYVTDEFKQLVEKSNLTGLEFRKVWEG